jgi:CheY-like chemotaxis protein
MRNNDVPKVILLAEDNADDAERAQAALKSAGVLNRVVVVTDGDEVIDYLEGKNHFSDRHKFPFPGILLLDLKMPRVDGFRVLSWLNFQGARKDLLVIVLSGNGELHNIKRAYEFGANSFLVKPFQVTEIENLVRAHKRFWVLSSAFQENKTQSKHDESKIKKADAPSRAPSDISRPHPYGETPSLRP